MSNTEQTVSPQEEAQFRRTFRLWLFGLLCAALVGGAVRLATAENLWLEFGFKMATLTALTGAVEGVSLYTGLTVAFVAAGTLYGAVRNEMSVVGMFLPFIGYCAYQLLALPFKDRPENAAEAFSGLADGINSIPTTFGMLAACGLLLWAVIAGIVVYHRRIV